MRLALAVSCLLAVSASAQVSSNASLNGKFYFRYTMLPTATKTSQTIFGTLTFDGNGGLSISGQSLVGSSAAAAYTSTGSYSVKAGGYASVYFSGSANGAAPINARLCIGAIVGASTEAAQDTYAFFLAVPAASNTANLTIGGPYWVSSLEAPNGAAANIRATNFKFTSTAGGSFLETAVSGQAANLGNTYITQTAGPNLYSVAGDGTGTLTIPLAQGADTTTQLIGGAKTIYVAQDGSFFFGGSAAAGGHGIVIGTKAAQSGASNATFSGLYFYNALRYDNAAGSTPARLTQTVGGWNGLTVGGVLAQHNKQSDATAPYDASTLVNYSIGVDGSAALTSTRGSLDLASAANAFALSSVDGSSSSFYQIGFGAKMAPQSGTGVFLHPQGIYNAATYAPAGAPVAPGEFVTMFGSGFGPATASASVPFPKQLAGVSVTVNGIAAPVYVVSPTQINAVVPNAVTGTTATFVVNAGGQSNPVTVPLAASTPGVFTLPQNGLGDGAILHTSYQVVSQSNPAVPGEALQIYLTGLGATTPAVADGAAAPSSGALAQVTGPVNVYIGGLQAPVLFKGLAPGFASLYQLNVQVPQNIGPGYQPLAIQTNEGYTDLSNVWVALNVTTNF